MSFLFFVTDARVRKTCREAQSSPLHLAAAVGDADICRLLLEKDKRLVSMRNATSATPLHIAAEYNHSDVITTLLELYALKHSMCN